MKTRKQLIDQEYSAPQLIPTGTKVLKPTVQLISTDINCTTVAKKKYKQHDVDYLFEDLSDLVNTSFKSWYCKMFYKIGKDQVLVIASKARSDGKQPAKLFSMMLKRAYNA